jgi:hypothetical protein
MSDLSIEAGLTHDTERDPAHRWSDRRPGYRGRDLGNSNQPKILREEDDSGGKHCANARNDNVVALVRCRIDQRTSGPSHHHARDAADGHHRSDETALPAVRQQEHAQEGSDPRLHVGHKEIQRLQRPNRAGLHTRIRRHRGTSSVRRPDWFRVVQGGTCGAHSNSR